MDATYCKEHARICRARALGARPLEQGTEWLYLASLWGELAVKKERGSFRSECYEAWMLAARPQLIN